MTALLKRAQDPIISPSDAWADDPFSRRKEGETLCKLIASSIDEPLVISLQSPWGSGKTVFLQRIAAHLSFELGILAIRIDAWRSDDADDPLSTIVAEIAVALNRKPKRSTTFATRVDRAISGLASFGTKAILPGASLIADAHVPGSGAVARTAASYGKSLLQVQEQKRKAAMTFRSKLEDARDLLTGSARGRPKKPMVLIIDELDRCRPDHAIRMLERIKHHFDIPGITFVIATDHGNLPSAVKTVYGRHVDGELYLRKFFDYEFHLKAPSPAAFSKLLTDTHLYPDNASIDFTKSFESMHFHELASSGIQISAELNKFEYEAYFSFYSEVLKLSLRDQSQAMTMLTVFLRTRGKSEVTLPLMDCLIACLRFSSPARFRIYLETGRISLPTNNDQAPDAALINRLVNSKLKVPILEFFKLKFDDLEADQSTFNNIQNTATSKRLGELDALAASLLLIRLRKLGASGKGHLPRVARLADALSD